MSESQLLCGYWKSSTETLKFLFYCNQWLTVLKGLWMKKEIAIYRFTMNVNNEHEKHPWKSVNFSKVAGFSLQLYWN